MGITFVSDYASLPSTAPPDHPHIIDVAAFTQSHEDKATGLRIQDAVVTMLYNISIGSSDVLGQFLDANKPSFRLVQKYKNPGNTDKLVIARKGDNVLVGVVTDYINEDCFEFDNLVRFTIDQDGSWAATYMSYRDYFRRNWDDVWAGRTVDLGFGTVNMKATPGHDYLQIWKLLPFQLASNIMSHRLWDAAESEWTITMT